MSNIKFCYTAYTLFDDLLNVKPMMTGCYQWLKVFDGEAVAYKNLEDPEKYDAIQVNLDGYDWRIIANLKKRLKGSSTKIVANQDYAPEIFNSAFEHPQDLISAMEDADCVFATTPSGQEAMQILAGAEKKIWLSPHPCETHVLKKIRSTLMNEVIGVFFHRYAADTINPWIVMNNLGFRYLIAAYYESYDKWFRRTKSIYPNLVPYLKFPDLIKFMRELRAGLFNPVSWTYGRVPCDAACAELPMVCSNTVYSAQICYPLTSVGPMEYNKQRELLKLLMTSESFRNEVIDIASYNVEYFGHEKCKERFMEMIGK